MSNFAPKPFFSVQIPLAFTSKIIHTPLVEKTAIIKLKTLKGVLTNVSS